MLFTRQTSPRGPKFAFNRTAPTGTPTLVGFRLTCPPAEEVEIVNQTISTMTVARDGTDTITVTGQLRYVANGTPVQDIRVFSYLTPVADAEFVPGPGATQERLLDENITDANGTFTLKGFPGAPSAPGMHNIVVEHRQSGYVSTDGVIYDGFVNLTENATLNHLSLIHI